MKGNIPVKGRKVLKGNEVELIRRTKDNYTHEVFQDKYIKEITTWKTSEKKLSHYYLYNILSCGIISLITKYKPLLFLKLYCIPSIPKEADYFLVEDIYSEYQLCNKENKIRSSSQSQRNEDFNNDYILGITSNNIINLSNHNIGFNYNSKFYEYNESINKIVPIFFNLTYLSNKRIYQLFIDGLSTISKVNQYKERYGLNICPFNLNIHLMYFLNVELTLLLISIIVALLEGIFGTFFYFILITTIISITIIIQIRLTKSNKLIREFTLDGQTKKIKVKRKYLHKESNEYCYINNIDLLPGDLIYLKKGESAPCDGIILEGECIITLSDVNGSISEIKKKELNNNSNQFNYKANKNSILYHGTKILKSFSKLENNSILLLCINTGANTYKANQLINVLYLLKRNKKYSEIYSKFCGKKKNLCIYSLILFILSSILLIVIECKNQVRDINFGNILYIILVLLSRCYVPCFHIVSSGIIFLGILYLLKENINCFDKSRLLYAGSVNTIFFDKTGTLTEKNLEIGGFLYTSLSSNSSEITLKYYNINQIKDLTSILINYYSNCQQQEDQYFNDNISHSNIYDKERKMNEIPKKMAVLFLECMVCCNNLEKINNQIYGNAIEKEIFSQIKWEMKINSEENKNKYNKHLFEEDGEDNINNHNDTIESNNTYNSAYEENENDSKYKIKTIEQKIDIYPNNYYKIAERKKKFNIPNNNQFENNSNSSKESVDSINSINDSEKRHRKYSKINQILEDIIQNENNNSYKLRIYKRFIKVGTLYSSAIIYNPISKTLHFMTKGPPEQILPNCDTSFLPKDINKIIALYRKSGYINLILASKIINKYNYDKSNKEDYYMCDLIFCGIIILKNKLKKDVKQAIRQLNKLNCDLILNTGDNIYNSLTVSYESGIISKKNIYVFDLNKMTRKIIVSDLSEISKNESTKTINYNIIDKISSNNLRKKTTTNNKIFSSRKMNIFLNKLEKINSMLGKDKNNRKKFDESNSKKKNLNPYFTEKIKKKTNKENVPKLKLEKVNTNLINSISSKQEIISPRKKNNNLKNLIKNYINEKITNLDYLNPGINSKNDLLEKSNNENQFKNISNNSNMLTTINDTNIINHSNYNSFKNKENKPRTSAVLGNLNKSIVNENISRQNSKNRFNNYYNLKRNETKITSQINNIINNDVKINIDYNPAHLKNMRNDCIYCISGRALRFIYENKFKPEFRKYEFPILLNHIKKFGKIFYEMKSKDKSFLIDYYRNIPDKITCMVGDSQNDIDAIMTSHIGININPPINYNTILCHFNPTDGSLFCIEKIIRYGRVIYENIYLLGITSFLSSVIIIFYIIILYINKMEVPVRKLDFLSCNCIILYIVSFIAKPDVTIKTSPLFNNPSLYKIFFIIISISNIIFNAAYNFLFLKIYTRNKEIESEIENNIFKTYCHILCYSQILGLIFTINSIHFYRISYQNNFIFWIIMIIVFFLLSFIYCICGYSFHPILYSYFTFEYSSKNGDTFDDKNKLVCYFIFFLNIFTFYIYTYILFSIFNIKAKKEYEKNEIKAYI